MVRARERIMEQSKETVEAVEPATVEHAKVVELLAQLEDRLGELRRHL
jgi:hypothetical protein